MTLGAGFYEKRSTTGRRLPRLPLQSELKHRAQELVKLKQEANINPTRAAAMTKKAAAVASKSAPDFRLFFGHTSAYAAFNLSHDQLWSKDVLHIAEIPQNDVPLSQGA
jgi:hypothetical protein